VQYFYPCVQRHCTDAHYFFDFPSCALHFVRLCNHIAQGVKITQLVWDCFLLFPLRGQSVQLKLN
jgi:hypothetical protein